ncbi:MAG: hypothetical protein IK062_02615 [Selenomonadaceae bacterium]|nr:hypothetical protein [Selenomonadaceae bacterium]
MPMDAGAIGIRPVTQQRPTGGVDSVQRRDDGSSQGGGFRPQTNVALKTAIEDLSNALSKISSQEKFGIGKMPQEVGEIVKNILQQSFSMEETLTQGIGSTIESQRFSMEQLTLFSRMLLQIGALADKGFSMQLSDETQLILSKFKDLLVTQEGGNSLEPVLLSKAAFELIDSKTAEQLPQAVYEILSQLTRSSTATPVNQSEQSDGMQFLKQLIQYFMPRPSTSETAPKGQLQQKTPQQQNQNPTQQNQAQSQQPKSNAPQQWQQAMRQSATQQFLQSMFRQLGGNKFSNVTQNQQAGQPQQNNFQNQQIGQSQQNNFQNQQIGQPQQNNFQSQQTGQPQQNNFQNQQTGQPQQNNFQNQQIGQPQQNNFTNQQTGQPQQNNFPNQRTGQPQQNNFQSQQTGQPQQNNFQNQQTGQPQQNNFQSQQTGQPQQNNFQNQQTSQSAKNPNQRIQNFDEDFLNQQQEIKEQMIAAKSLMLKQPIQNDSQTMDAMKNLAKFFMHRPETSARDAATLQNFVNNTQQMMPESEARHLQNLLRLCQQNVPVTVQQAAVQQNLPDLPRLWAFMQMCEMARLTNQMNAKAFKRAGKDVAEFTNSMRQAMGGENSTVQNQRSFQMMLPLYIGENEHSYPTYLSVYDENEKDKETGENKKETWVRICVLTDNIGAAELTFRVYEESQLDMRFYFSHRDVARDFRNYLEDLKNSLRETSFKIGEIRIGSIGEKMEAG